MLSCVGRGMPRSLDVVLSPFLPFYLPPSFPLLLSLPPFLLLSFPSYLPPSSPSPSFLSQKLRGKEGLVFSKACKERNCLPQSNRKSNPRGKASSCGCMKRTGRKSTACNRGLKMLFVLPHRMEPIPRTIVGLRT